VGPSTGGKGPRVGHHWDGLSSDEDSEGEGSGESLPMGMGMKRRMTVAGVQDMGGGEAPALTLSPRQGQCIKSGYLWKRSNNVRKDWKRRYFFIQAGKLFYQRQEVAVSPPIKVCDIKLCTVRACTKDTDLRFSFEIISPRQRTYLLQAEDEESLQSWVHIIRAEIEHLLSSSQAGCTGRFLSFPFSSFRPGGSLSRGSSPPRMHALKGSYCANGSKPKEGEASLDVAQLTRLSMSNPECVDCGECDPDWASISLGVMMCIECSGIHRSMGVHVSKVRSLTLDKWTQTLVGVLERVGNDTANTVWEANREEADKLRIGPGADRASREAFIRAKYQHKRFLLPAPDKSPASLEEVNRRLFNSCAKADMADVVWCLAHGADVNWNN
ncbi:unnamed protein product, partial [Discosporangium mesarthrocarpum]